MKLIKSSVWENLIALALLCTALSTPAAASPIEQLKSTMNRLLGIVQGADHGPEGDGTARRETLRAALSPRFDFREMARIALGKYWDRQADRQQEFVSAFGHFVENSYVSKVEALKDASIVYVREQVNGDYAQVDTQIVPPKGDAIPIHYRLHLVGAEWKIYDIVAENISLAENFRSQFQRVLTKTTFDDLLKRLQQKISTQGG